MERNAIQTTEQKTKTLQDLLFKNPRMRRQIEMAIPKHLTPDRLLRVAMTSIRTNPALLDCTPQSLLACVMGCAQLGLEPEPFLGQAYLVPYYNKKKGCREAQLIPGYRGYIALARRSGQVESVSAQCVYENDDFDLQYGIDEKLNHKPARGDRGDLVGAYVIFKYKDGGYSFDYMPKGDIEKIRRRSKSPDSGPWATDYEEMAKKTVIRRHVKIAPLSIEMAAAANAEALAMAGETQTSMFLDGVDVPREMIAHEENDQIEKPVYVVHQATEMRPENDRPVEGPRQERPIEENTIGTASNEVEKQEPNESSAGGWQTGDIAYYKLGQGIGWKQLRIIGFEGDDAVVEFAEDYEHNGKQMKGQISKKPLADLREAVPQPLTRDEFINLRSGFTKEYLESIQERIEETRDPKIIADLINKAKKFLGDDHSIPGLPPAPDEPPVEEPGEESQDVPTAGEARISDDPERKAIKRINALINERGMDKAGVKLAMRNFVIHLKGEQPIRPFDVDSTNDIQVQHVQYFEEMLDGIQPQHEIALLIDHYAKQVKGFGDYVKQKMLLFPNPVEVPHWYLLPPGAVHRIKLNIDDWAKEVLEMQESASEKF